MKKKTLNRPEAKGFTVNAGASCLTVLRQIKPELHSKMHFYAGTGGLYSAWVEMMKQSDFTPVTFLPFALNNNYCLSTQCPALY